MYGYIAPIPKDISSLKESTRFGSDFIKSFNLLADPRNGIDVFPFETECRMFKRGKCLFPGFGDYALTKCES